jgi:glucose/arabinose dehydrogenase
MSSGSVSRRLAGILLVAEVALPLATPSTVLGIRAELVAGGLDFPVFVGSPGGDERLFIVEQRGVIKILKQGLVLPTPFLDIQPLVFPPSQDDERGFLGLAFHPNYAANRYFYVMYNDHNWRTVVARYRTSAANPDRALPGSALILLVIDQPAPNHKGGTILFGPNDGYLYIGMGDGGTPGDLFNNGQRDDSLLGKMLRIDVDHGNPYAIPLSNPYASPGLPLDEIWARGFRNPYRWSFDRATGDMFIGDVGEQFWEEIDYQPAASKGGENYGWRLMEGTHCYNPPKGCDDGTLIHPIHEYQHIFHCAVVGGYVYRGEAMPGLDGTYFFGDYCTAKIWSFRYESGQVLDFTDRTTELSPQGEIRWISGFGEDAAGELYVVDRGSSGPAGEVWKIMPSGPIAVGDGAEATPPPRLALSPAAPNPFAGSTRVPFELASAPRRFVAAIYTAAGRQVTELGLPAAAFTSGSAALEWDGRDARGRACPAGVYLLRVEADGASAQERLVLLR